jgi:Rps23 Pro-64 3,4-dihydroxylase Tpa1-like proline 4-hydroxylase
MSTPIRGDNTVSDQVVAHRDLDAEALRDAYRKAQPFPHIVLDDVLEPATLRCAMDEFASAETLTWTNHLHVNNRKFANSNWSTWGPTLRSIAEEFMTPDFVRFVEELTGIPELLVDPTFDGGGLHRSVAGCHLNIHADFTSHHRRPTWRRRVNLLLYFNDDWDDAWGGHLELWDRDVTRCVERIAPIANRLVLFTTTEDSFHGHPAPLETPPHVSRNSLALYYFTESECTTARPTRYRARPDDGWRRVLIAADQQVLRAYDVAKRRLHLSDEFASRWLGRLDRRKRSNRR